MITSRRWLFLALLGLSLTACERSAQQQGAAPPPAEVDVVLASRASAILTQDLPGRLQAWRTAQVRARVNEGSFLARAAAASGEELSAYEIHMGVMEPAGEIVSPFQILSRNGQAMSAFDGAVSDDRAVVGTMLHGLFENAWLRSSMIRSLRRRSGLAEPSVTAPGPDREAEYDRLAAIVRGHIDLALLQRLAGLAR